MNRITKDALRGELRLILLCQADHILITASREAATSFIGFDTGFHRTYDFMHLQGECPEVDLDRFAITGLLDKAYDFALTPSLENSIGETDVTKLITFMNGVPRVGGYGEARSFTSSNGLCQTIVDTAHARWKLEMERGGTFTARELALLANMSEGAVRNAMSDKSESGLKVIHGSKPAQVDWSDARDWLHGRRGFVPTPTKPSLDETLKARFAAVKTAQELGALIYTHATLLDPDTRHEFEENEFGTYSSFFEVDRACGGLARLGWSESEYAAWIRGTFEFDTRKATDLAKALDFDVPAFAAKALEVSLRRDAEIEGDRS